jgi:peptidoglycan/xylan/chitin deacetylase (PgdA/CDA1 family)
VRAILTYHSLDESGSPISLAPEAFRRHVAWLVSGGVPVVPVSDLLAVAPGGDAVAVTFDDAFTSFREVAWPLLREHGIPATVFVPADHAGRTNAWPDERVTGVPTLPLLDWDALARLTAEGCELGSHSRSHRDLRGLDDAALGEELEGAAARIEERTGARPRGLAYPYGLADDRVVRAAARAYRFACTAAFRPLAADDDFHRLPRLDAYYFARPGLLESWGTWRFDAYWRARAAGRRIRGGLERLGLLG